MFMGEYAHTIDAKGRVILPADFRQELGVSFFFSGARTLECDKQGRFLVPANLRAYADIMLRQPVVLAGADNRIEVWSKEQWSRYNEEVEPDVTAIAASLAELGI